jgi:hypothetical protein
MEKQQSSEDLVRIGTITTGSCLLIIPSPRDEVVYGCFRSIAGKWRDHVTGEGLWIESDVPVTAGLTTSEPSESLMKLMDSSADIVSRIDLRFGGLLLSFIRSGGQGPTMFRQSFFDEIRAECHGTSSIDAEEILDVFAELCECLEARRGIGTLEFTRLLMKSPLGLKMEVSPVFP